MTIGPKKKISQSKWASRHSTWLGLNLKKLKDKYQTTNCKNCGAVKLAYRVCPSCGYYKWKQVLTIKSKSKDKIVDA